MEKRIDTFAETMEEIETISRSEPPVQEAFRAARQSWIKYILKKNGYQLLMPMVEEKVHMMGSVADGCFSARFYSEDTPIFESDFLLDAGQLESDDLIPVHNKPGFYFVKTQNLHHRLGLLAKLVNLNPTSEGSVSHVIDETGGGFLLGDSEKKMLRDLSPLDEELSLIMNAAAKILETDVGKKLECFIHKEFNGPAVTFIIEIHLNSKHQFSVSIDIVVAGSLNFWPPEAAEWPTRTRKWPPQKVVDDIIRDHDIHLVGKPVDTYSEYQNTGRLTFMAEKKIIQEWSIDMKLTYYIFKILFYAHFKKEIQGETLSSYLAKTTMFWACEEYDPNDWTKDRIAQNLKHLLHKLLDFLKKDHLPHYFVPDINLLSNVPKTLLSYITEMDISDLFEDPIKYIPQRLDHVRNNIDFNRKVYSAWDKAINEMAEKLPDNTLSVVSQFFSKPEPFEPVVDDDLD